MRPVVGQSVHYVANSSGASYAAIVTAVYDNGIIDLSAFPPPNTKCGELLVGISKVPEEQVAPRVGTWHWPR